MRAQHPARRCLNVVEVDSLPALRADSTLRPSRRLQSRFTLHQDFLVPSHPPALRDRFPRLSSRTASIKKGPNALLCASGPCVTIGR